MKSESWWIENPVSKDLTKRITIKLGPKAEQEFVVVLKAPNARRSQNLVSKISLSLLTYADEQFGVKQTFEDYLRTHFKGSMKEFLRDRKPLAQAQAMQILLASRVEIPQLVCHKSLMMTPVDDLVAPSPVIPLVVRKDAGK